MREANLRALGLRDRELAGRLAAAAPDPAIVFTRSRTGVQVPCVEAAGRRHSLHSLVDPAREGARNASAARGAGFVVALGLGAGCHLRPLLDQDDLSGLLVFERDEQALSALVSGADLRDILADPRVVLAAGEDPAGMRDLLLRLYSTVLCGPLRVLSLRPWCDAQPGWAGPAARAVREAAEGAAADFATQGRFGRRWFTNILGNLPLAEVPPAPLPAAHRALVAAAGPSLEGQLAEIAAGREGALLVAVDTALPALEAAGIRPDIVVSIDCQHHSCYHFYGAPARRERLVLDLASPPALARLTRDRTFAASAHPLCALASRRWRQFPAIDVSGGNVAYAAVALAGQLGARSIRIYGADFSYPGGKPYARGTYLYEYFGCRAGRLAPAETAFFSFLFRAGEPVRERVESGIRCTTPLLLAYRDSLIALASRLDAEVSAAPGQGLPLPFARRGSGGVQRRTEQDASPRPSPRSWRGFLRWYNSTLSAAPGPRPPLTRWFAALDPAMRETWQTMLPVAAFELRQSGGAAGAEGAAARVAALERARTWALARLSLALSEDDPRVADE